jgi:hypothetical protein
MPASCKGREAVHERIEGAGLFEGMVQWEAGEDWSQHVYEPKLLALAGVRKGE